MAELNRNLTKTFVATSAFQDVLEDEKGRVNRISKSLGILQVATKHMTAVVMVFVVLLLLISSVNILMMQQNITAMNNTITETRRDNDSLKVTILKTQDVETAKAWAAQSNFVDRRQSKSIEADLSYDNFTGDEVKTAEETFLGNLLAFFQ